MKPQFRPDVHLPAVVLQSEPCIQHMTAEILSTMDRRGFLKRSTLATGGLILAFGCMGVARARASEGIASAASASEVFIPNGFIQISPDGRILIYASSPEAGQGVKTSLPMMVAEELEVPWEQVSVELSEVDGARYGPQFAGGSLATPFHFDRMRSAGATARMMLIQAAANRWQVPVSECRAELAEVIHDSSGKRLSYADLCIDAAKLPVPDAAGIVFKDRKDYRILGKWKTGVDNHAIVTGKPLFGSDIRLPGMKVAVYVKCPSEGGSVQEANLEAVRAARGVVDAFILDAKSPPEQLRAGVAILADDTWSAFQAANLLRVTWDRSQASEDSWTAHVAQAKEAAASGGPIRKEVGNALEAIEQADKVVESFYQFPFIAHATLETMNCTAHFHDGRMEVWAPSQTPQDGPRIVASVTGLEQSQVKVHQLRIGGGFGRRLMNDYVAEVAAIAHRVNYPVKLVWTREQDTAHGFFRVGGFHKIRAGLDAEGKIQAWHDHCITFTAGGEKREAVRGGGMNEWVWPVPQIANQRLEETRLDLKIPTGWWRAPGSCTLAWVTQSFLHECAVAAGRDYVEYMLDLLGEPRWLVEGNTDVMHTGRAAAVIKLAAEKAGWGTPLPKGHGRGIAFYFCHKGHFAEVAEVSVDERQTLKLNRVVVAGDVGLIINRSGAWNQIEGSVIDGYNSMVAQEITYHQGAIEQSNFHDINMIRIGDQPKIEIHMIESEFPPTGLGEPALPPLLPAVCNAIFDATGKRVRTLPLTREGFRI